MIREDIIAYSELIEILQYVSANDYYKIPKKEREFYYKNADADYYFRYNPNKTLEENNVSDKTKKILAYIFKQYWATETQKEKIKNYDRAYYEKIEEEKREKYNPDDIFGNSNKDTISSCIETKQESKDLLVVKENLFKKIINKILTFIK